jgi:hypothetical protein
VVAPQQLRRTVSVAVIVGTAFFAMNQLGVILLIEPFANDDLGDNLNPVGAAYYGFSTLLCTPSSLSQDVGTALGAQAGEARLRDIVTGAGFTTLRRVAETRFNIVLQATAS